MVGVRRPFPQGFRKQLQLSSRQIFVILHDDFCDEATDTLEDQPLQVHVQQSQHFSDFRTNKQLTRLMSHFIQVADTSKLHSSSPCSNTAPPHTRTKRTAGRSQGSRYPQRAANISRQEAKRNWIAITIVKVQHKVLYEMNSKRRKKKQLTLSEQSTDR